MRLTRFLQISNVRAPIASSLRVRRRDTHYADRTFFYFLRTMGWAMIAIMGGMIGLLSYMAWPALQKFGFSFFTRADWNPPMDIFGALPFIYGTLVSSLLAILIAAPVSVGVALFLTELAPSWLRQSISFLVEMLAAIPSIVYGLWGVFVLAPFMQSNVQPWLIDNLGPDTVFSVSLARVLLVFVYPGALIGQLLHVGAWTFQETSQALEVFTGHLFGGPAYGVGMLTASVVLAIMVTPTISAICREVFSAVPSSIREASLALGATRIEMIQLSVLQTCRSGILGAVILGLGRALGETMAVTMVIGNRNEIRAALLAPAQTLASVLANEYNEASGLHISALAAVGLTLMMVSLVINSCARYVIWRVEVKRT